LRCGDDRRDHLRGEVLPIGGLKEKLLAASRRHQESVDSGRNVKDLAEIPDNIKNKSGNQPVKWIDQGA
jgi:ATP-dependent Lon protease